MKYSLLIAALLSATALFSVETIQETSVEDSRPITVEQAAGDVPMNDYASKEHKHEHEHATSACPTCDSKESAEPVLEKEQDMLITVTGQGVAPVNTSSPAQAYALAKRAAVADAYRMIAEKVKGVRIDGQDLIKNMMVKRSTVRTSVQAMVRNANVVETTFKEGLCEVEMEITISHADFAQ